MTSPQAPEIYSRPLAEFGLPGTPEEQAQQAIAQIALEYGVKGWNAAVVCQDGMVRVLAVPEQGIEPLKYLTGLCQHGYIADALPGLEALDSMIDQADVAFNHGVALSELGRPEDALEPLQKALRLDPEYTDAAIALGVAYAKLQRNDEAEATLKAAAKSAPDNALLKQNLAAILANAGKLTEALPVFRQAASLAPNNPVALMGLAQCLNSLDGYKDEALKVYREVATKFPGTPFAESAKGIINRAGSDKLHSVVGGSIRPDAVEYMLAAMKRFSKMDKQKVGQIVLEIAQAGEKGFSFDTSKRYHFDKLKMDDGMSGLQAVCYMHVGLRMFQPDIDAGTGLDREYEVAKGMFSK